MATRARKPKPAVVSPIADDAFGPPAKHIELLHRALLNHAQNVRQGTQSTKTRGQVAGSTAKLFRQKGTGRARAGAITAGQRRGGGVTFGPQPRVIERRMSRRERREALRGILAEKTIAQRVHSASSWGDGGKTKDRVAWLSTAGLSGRVLLVDLDPPDELRRSARNIPGVTVARADSIGFYDVAVADHVVASEAALELLQGANRA